MSAIQFKTYSHPYYQQVCDFLIALNREKKHINWNWARWEWMYAHPYCDRENLHTIGLWLDGETIMGAAIYDLFHGEAFCGALDRYEYLLPEILEYAYANLKDENGLGIAARDDDISMQEQLARMGYHKAEQTETILCRDLNKSLDYELPSGFAIREIRFPEDNLAYQTVVWKGFGHEGDQAELEKMLTNKILPPNRRSVGGRKKFCLPIGIARAFVPFFEWIGKIKHTRPLYTRYSLYTISSNSHFTHDKATAELGYHPRDMQDTIRDTISWLRGNPVPLESA